LILLDTHIWVWWIGGDPKLPARYRDYIREHESEGLAVSVISCWEVALKSARGQLQLTTEAPVWIRSALDYPGIMLADLTVDIVVEATRLPAAFHRDPADRMLVATARLQGCPLLTADAAILQYPHVRLAIP
jgi:PIN domain nuclease of toxin-antitoxin system